MENELNARKLLFFDVMLTPKIITFVYWIAIAVVVISGFSSMFFGGFGFFSFLRGLFFIALGLLGARVYCELMIVIFKINENIQKLSGKDPVVDQ